MIMNKNSNTAIFIENTMFFFIFNQCFSYDQNRINNLSKDTVTRSDLSHR